MKELALEQQHHHGLAHDEPDLTARPILRRAARARERDRSGRDANAGGDVGVAGLFSQAVNAGLGHALPDDLRETFETSLGTSLAGVRVHTDGAAAASADGFDAHAFAHGQDIFFGAGQYRPGTPDGDQLIAHEVAHTVQQRGAAPTTQHKLAISEPGDAMEHAADEAALAMTRGERTGVGSAGLTIARQSRGAAQAHPTVAAAGPQTIAQRFPQGITVAVALEPTPIGDLTTHILRETPRPMLGAIMHRNHEQLIAHPAKTALDASLAAGDHPVTEDDARNIATVLHANDSAFLRAAAAFAHTQPVVGGDPASPRVGRPVTFSETENAIEMILALSRAVGPLPGARDGANIRHLAIFTHGWHDGLRLGRLSALQRGASGFVAALGGALTRDVTVGMYGCNAAGGESSFAQNVTEGLAQGGHDVRVFGHENAAHTTGNPRGREFLARAGQAHADSNTNYELVFAAAFRTAEINGIAHALDVPPAAVERVFDDAACEWMVGVDDRHAAIARIRASDGGERVAFEMGYNPHAAVEPIRAAWRTEGLAVIRRALVSPARAPRHVTNTHVGHDAALNGITWESRPQPGTAQTPAAPGSPTENRETSAATKPQMDPHAKDPVAHAQKPAMAPHAKDPVVPHATPAAPIAPAPAASSAPQGALAIVQRPGPLHPRHPGNGMALYADAEEHAGASRRRTVEHVPPGTFVHVVRRAGDWTLVSHRGLQGWIENANLRDATLSEADVRQEAEYRLGVLETQNDAGEYGEDQGRVNIGVGSWTGGWIRGLLNRYRQAAIRHGQLAALYDHFGSPEHYEQLITLFTDPDMEHERQIPDERPRAHPGTTRRWTGPRLDPQDQERFRTAASALSFIREADEGYVHDNITTYLYALRHTAYPFFGADHSIREVALNIIVSGFHQAGLHGLGARIHTTNAHFGVPTHPQDEHHPDPPQNPLNVRQHTDELTYLRQLGTLLPSHTRYAAIISLYADSPRRYPVP